MNIIDLAVRLAEFHRALLANGFKPRQAMELTVAHQHDLLTNDMIERQSRIEREGGQPWT